MIRLITPESLVVCEPDSSVQIAKYIDDLALVPMLKCMAVAYRQQRCSVGADPRLFVRAGAQGLDQWKRPVYITDQSGLLETIEPAIGAYPDVSGMVLENTGD